MSRPYSRCGAGPRTMAATMLALRALANAEEDDTAECTECLGLGGSWSYPNAMSRIWHECDDPRCIDGRVPL